MLTFRLSRAGAALVDFDPGKCLGALSVCQPENQINQLSHFRGLEREMAKKDEPALEVRVDNLRELWSRRLFERRLASGQVHRAELHKVLQFSGDPVSEEGFQKFAAPLRGSDVKQLTNGFAADFHASAQPAGNSRLVCP